MKARRLVLAWLASFVFIFVFEWLFHGILLKNVYAMVPELWRPRDAMTPYLPYLFGGQLLTALFLTLIFAKGYENRGWNEGIRFGMLMGGLIASGHIMWYAVQPIPAILDISWILSSVVEMIGVGIVLAAICRPKV